MIRSRHRRFPRATLPSPPRARTAHLLRATASWDAPTFATRMRPCSRGPEPRSSRRSSRRPRARRLRARASRRSFASTPGARGSSWFQAFVDGVQSETQIVLHEGENEIEIARTRARSASNRSREAHGGRSRRDDVPWIFLAPSSRHHPRRDRTRSRSSVTPTPRPTASMAKARSVNFPPRPRTTWTATRGKSETRSTRRSAPSRTRAKASSRTTSAKTRRRSGSSIH